MGVLGILGSSFLAGGISRGTQNKFQQIQQGFQQLGQDLQSGNLSQAQNDFSTLERLLPSQLQTSATNVHAGALASSSLAQSLKHLGQDLSSGNLSAAQSDFATLQQDIQQKGTSAAHLHDRRHGVGFSFGGLNQQNSISSLFETLGQDLQTRNLAAAQQTYSTLQQDFQEFSGASTSTGSGGATSGTTGLNVAA